MQRISAIYAKPGMELAGPVYDNWGDVVIPTGTVLDARDLAQIDDIGVGELLIVNSKASEVQVVPLVPPELEGAISKALRRVMIECRTVLIGRNPQPIDLVLVNNMMDELLEIITGDIKGDPSIAGCFSLRDYNYVHPVKVASISMLIARAKGMKKKEIKQVGMAALFQNIGYVLLPQGVLDKSGFLNYAEMKAVQRHPVYGAQILERYTDVGSETANMVFQHHEKWDGSGYPLGLKKQDISVAARILGITDVCFALASKRPHREEFLPSFAIEHSIVSAQDAIEYIVAYSGEQFDPELVRIFTKLVPLYPAGAMVKLNDGSSGIVCKSNPEYFRRPKVRIISGGRESGREMLDICTGCELECDEKHLKKETKRDIDLAKENQKNVLINELSDY
ncbi:MAG: HD domain-containing protein [Dehalococcoidia bacterium]|nr:HD domain-containing protein [Dehalococcoidia bacterium]MDD5495266.1 HD domain-containing protein [Dehalococcoidia bacterium]